MSSALVEDAAGGESKNIGVALPHTHYSSIRSISSISRCYDEKEI